MEIFSVKVFVKASVFEMMKEAIRPCGWHL